jgi:predicted nucleic acid-binding Zn ribbon protein
MMTMKEPEKIGNAILEALGKMGFTERLKRQSAVTKWPELVGETIAKETEALRIDGDTLVVRVYKAAWRQQLVYFKEELLAKLKAELGDDSVEDIRFV